MFTVTLGCGCPGEGKWENLNRRAHFTCLSGPCAASCGAESLRAEGNAGKLRPRRGCPGRGHGSRSVGGRLCPGNAWPGKRLQLQPGWARCPGSCTQPLSAAASAVTVEPRPCLGTRCCAPRSPLVASFFPRVIYEGCHWMMLAVYHWKRFIRICKLERSFGREQERGESLHLRGPNGFPADRSAPSVTCCPRKVCCGPWPATAVSRQLVASRGGHRGRKPNSVSIPEAVRWGRRTCSSKPRETAFRKPADEFLAREGSFQGRMSLPSGVVV